MVWLHRTPFSLLSDIDRLASAAVDRMARVAWPEADVDAPRANVHLAEREAGVEFLIPGYGPEHVQVSVEGRRLSVKGERKEGEGDTARVVASFERTLELPFDIDGDNVQAKLEHGVLRLALPKLVKGPARVISVR
jgi:HSP20 family protein